MGQVKYCKYQFCAKLFLATIITEYIANHHHALDPARFLAVDRVLVAELLETVRSKMMMSYRCPKTTMTTTMTSSNRTTEIRFGRENDLDEEEE